MIEELNKCLNVLKKGGLILYPTDTIWGIGCDATNYDAVQKVFELKKRAESKALVCLVHDYKMLNQYIENIPEVAYDILKYAQKPTTIIYDKAKLVAEKGTISAELQADLDRLSEANIPVDVIYEQGTEVLGL